MPSDAGKVLNKCVNSKDLMKVSFQIGVKHLNCQEFNVLFALPNACE